MRMTRFFLAEPYNKSFCSRSPEGTTLSRLPVIASFGGINPAGRTSLHHAYRRLVIDALPPQQANETILCLASLMNLVHFKDGCWIDSTSESPLSVEEIVEHYQAHILEHTLIRKLEKPLLDVSAFPQNKRSELRAQPGEHVRFIIKKRDLPDTIPDNWEMIEQESGHFEIIIDGALSVILDDTKEALVKSAGQLPTGFDPSQLYPSRNHPRGLQLTVYGASDCIQSSGLAWETIKNAVNPDEIVVYASSSIGQLDEHGAGGLIRAPAVGKRCTSKQLPLAFPEMVADFINGYIIGSVGSTSALLGACATFLYNLDAAVKDIRNGKFRVALIGCSEAPITAEIMEGFRTMGALADDASLLELDQREFKTATQVDHKRACRPFAENCGFTLAESAQFMLLMDDALAVELGANILGAVPEVSIHTDGFKKSIASPGIGNYITMARCAAFIKSMLGEDVLKNKTYVQAHGTGTPQNRVTESHVINETAKAFGIDKWLVTAVKSYVGHPLATAAGDQLTSTLGAWQYGIIPGITTTHSLASDVHSSNINFALKHVEVKPDAIDAVIINSKGFGGNNASAVILAPHVVQDMLAQKYDESTMNMYHSKVVHTRTAIATYDKLAIQKSIKPIYHFGENVLEGTDLTITSESISIPGYDNPISLNVVNPFADFKA